MTRIRLTDFSHKEVKDCLQKPEPVVGATHQTDWEQVHKTVREYLNLKPPKVTRP